VPRTITPVQAVLHKKASAEAQREAEALIAAVQSESPSADQKSAPERKKEAKGDPLSTGR